MEAVATQPKILTWEQILKDFPDQWVVLGNPVFGGKKVKEAIVISNHVDKRVASIEGGERRKGYKTLTSVFPGKSKPVRRIGILSTRTVPILLA